MTVLTAGPLLHDLPAPPPLPDGAALFLDFDGTLAPLAARPDAVQVPEGIPALLDEVHQHLDGAVAIVTGRQLADVDPYLAPFRFGGAGLHGAELRPVAGTPAQLQWQLDTRPLLDALEKRFAADARILIENKAACVALHYRQAPERGQECRDAMHHLVPRDFEVITGSMVVEARPRGTGKGRAVHALLAHAPFQGRTPVFVGDDVTDEDGFAAAAELRGFGVKVGAGTTVARYGLPDPAALVRWLRACLGHGRRA